MSPFKCDLWFHVAYMQQTMSLAFMLVYCLCPSVVGGDARSFLQRCSLSVAQAQQRSRWCSSNVSWRWWMLSNSNFYWRCSNLSFYLLPWKREWRSSNEKCGGEECSTWTTLVVTHLESCTLGYSAYRANGVGIPATMAVQRRSINQDLEDIVDGNLRTEMLLHSEMSRIASSIINRHWNPSLCWHFLCCFRLPTQRCVWSPECVPATTS